MYAHAEAMTDARLASLKDKLCFLCVLYCLLLHNKVVI